MISLPDSPHSPELDPASSPAFSQDPEPNPQDRPQDKKEQDPAPRADSPALKEFSDRLNGFATPEEKIAFGLQFMRTSISQEGSPRFREFWEARKQVLPFFKENLNPAIRSKLWDEYVELTVEARRLKEILEEQSAFAMEQIDLAVKSLEEEMANASALVAQGLEIAFPASSETIQQKAHFYNQLQRELNLLNTLASRLNGLRKEVVKTDMRIRFKTKFFKRLSELGDKIFPRRKELIESVSSEFEKDVDQFISRHFKGEQVVGAPYYALREEIKSLQGMAKLLTLSSAVFTRTRLNLSECWDKVKVLEKEHKKEILEKKHASSEQRQAIQSKIEALKEKSSEMSLHDVDQAIDSINIEMRGVPLQRDDVRFLREELYKIRAPFIQAQEQKARDLEEAEKEKLRLKKEKIADIKEKISHLSKEGDRMDLDSLVPAFEDIQKEIQQIELSKIDKQQMDRHIRQLKDLVADKKEHSLLNLSDDEKKTLENLQTVLQQKKQRRQEIKDQLEIHRKTLGNSNLDFEKAMHYRELVDQDKERLEKANAGIEEIERKITDLES